MIGSRPMRDGKGFIATALILVSLNAFAQNGQTGLSPTAPAAPARMNVPSAPTVVDPSIGSTLAYFLGEANPSTNLMQIDATVPKEAKPKDQPWSGSYWALHVGSIGDEYARRIGLIKKINSFDKNKKVFEKQLEKILDDINDLDEKVIDKMSPSEKYDLYLGDHRFTLTRAAWQTVVEVQDRFKKVPLWTGSCQGWSVASIFVPRPQKAITIMSLDGRYLIPFYPDDLKALATLLWANSLVQDQAVLVGMRCNSKHPQVDETNGKVLDTTCQGVNPGVFHLALLEIMGKKKSSFVMNRTNNTEVWNQPLSAYSFQYYNLLDSKEGSLKDSMVEIAKIKDRFSKYRPAGTKYLVGVNMVVSYQSETRATHHKENSEKNDKVKKMYLRYDLELDQNYQVLGGEWLDSKDPDPEEETDSNQMATKLPTFPGFIWKFQTMDPAAYSIVDSKVPEVNSSNYNAQTLVPLSREAAAFRYNHYKRDANGNQTITYQELMPQPIAKVVNALIQMSSH